MPPERDVLKNWEFGCGFFVLTDGNSPLHHRSLLYIKKGWAVGPSFLIWRLWAEIEAHKWRDLELNLSKTATTALEF